MDAINNLTLTAYSSVVMSDEREELKDAGN